MSASFDPPFDPDREGSDPDRPFPFLGPPQQDGDLGSLGEYRVVRELGRGGMGVVFRGEDTVLHRPVALKVMTPRAAAAENARDRFLREARAAAAISSEYVVRIHTVGETPPVGKAGGVPYLVMEYLEGCTLEDWLRGQGNTASAAVAVRIADDVLRGLADAHAKGLIHRDIKPQNIWLDAATGRFKLLDLGLTRAADGSGQVTRENVFVGTPQYVAPEQARNRPPDPRSDLFGLGVVIYTPHRRN